MFGCIRVATPRDAKAIAEIYETYVRDTAISFERNPPTPSDMEARIERTLSVYPWLVFEDDEIGGYAYASQFGDRDAYRWAATVSVYVRRGFHRKGIGRGLCVFLLHLLERQGHTGAYAGITLPNPGSVGLFESLGFAPVGVYKNVGFKAGRWRDVGWWQRPMGEPQADPIPPIPFSALR